MVGFITEPVTAAHTAYHSDSCHEWQIPKKSPLNCLA